MGLPSSRLQLQMWLVLNQLQLKIFRAHGSATLQHMYPNEGPKMDPPDGTTFDFEGVHFLTLSDTCLLSTGAQNWTLKMLNPVPPWRCHLRSPKNLRKSRCPSPDLHQITQTSTSTEISNKGREQGRPLTPSPKKLSILDSKNEPFKSLPCPACLYHYLPWLLRS